MTSSPARRAASLVLAALALGGTTTARADGATPVSAEGAAAAADIAKTYWSATPCGDQVAISWQVMAPKTNATSVWANPVSAYDAPEQNSQCAIIFNSALQWDWTRYCSILVHEYGHLTGHDHSSDPGDVMYAYYLKPVKECEAAAPAEPATEPEHTASTASLPEVNVAALSKQKAGAHKAKRAQIVVVREPHRLRGKAMKRHRRGAARRVRMHRARV